MSQREREAAMLECDGCAKAPFADRRPDGFELMQEHAAYVKPCERHKEAAGT